MAPVGVIVIMFWVKTLSSMGWNLTTFFLFFCALAYDDNLTLNVTFRERTNSIFIELRSFWASGVKIYKQNIYITMKKDTRKSDNFHRRSLNMCRARELYDLTKRRIVTTLPEPSEPFDP